ncbi:MAG: phage replisome organizer N-terminal domain-containing protein [Clostridia bacterium]|nr:phage replisome organizer N-terminal domain-containing protein [Clostridia bacterium]
MSNEKRYYWLKFRDDFFNSVRIKKLRKMAGGDTYVIIYLKMQLKALKTGGVLQYKGVEQDFPEELALDIDEEPDDVRMVLSFLLAYDLCECSDNVHYFLPYVAENTGSETAGTQRWRDWKNRKDALKDSTLLNDNQQKALDSNTSPTLCQQNANVEKEIEKDIDIIPPFIPPLQGEESDKKGKKGKIFVPPTLDEVKKYVEEKNLNVDPETFYDYFTTPDYAGRTWMDSEGKPVKNWKQKLQTWSKKKPKESDKGRNTLKNYQEEGKSHSAIKDIGFNIDEL